MIEYLWGFFIGFICGGVGGWLIVTLIRDAK